MLRAPRSAPRTMRLLAFPPRCETLQYAIEEASLFDVMLRINAHKRVVGGTDTQEQLAAAVSNASVSVYTSTSLEVANAREVLDAEHPDWPTIVTTTRVPVALVMRMQNQVTKLKHLMAAPLTRPRVVTVAQCQRVQTEMMVLQGLVRQCLCQYAAHAYEAHIAALQARARKRFPLVARTMKRTTSV